jgi:integrase
MPIETRKKKNPTPGAKKNLKTSASAAKVRKVAKKSLIMKVPPPSNTNPDKAPVLDASQKRFYCKVATDLEKAKFRQQGFPDAVYSPLRPLGVNTITVLLGAAARKLGCGDSKGHGFRRIFVTSLVNDAGVNTEEAIRFARHKSVAAQHPYMMRNQDSEMAKFRALGLV